MDNNEKKFIPVSLYKCRFCGNLYKSTRRHSCRFDEAKKNCLSCKHLKLVIDTSKDKFSEMYGKDNRDSTKYFVCDQKGLDDMLTDIYLLKKNGWILGCSFHETIEGYEGKQSYIEHLSRRDKERKAIIWEEPDEQMIEDEEYFYIEGDGDYYEENPFT